jgi:bifunctional phosphoserine phosphatase/homoserine phosphotransferase
MEREMEILCLDLEGVLVPEIWINVAERTGIDELRATTRDIPDYDVLMRQRLEILEEHGLKIGDIQSVIAKMGPMDGALEFLGWLNGQYQVAILSDTFYQFAQPLIDQLGNPLLLCHNLEIAENGRVEGYRLRQPDSKRSKRSWRSNIVLLRRETRTTTPPCLLRRTGGSFSVHLTTSSRSFRSIRSQRHMMLSNRLFRSSLIVWGR